MKLVNVPCMLCAKSALVPVLQKETYSIVKCTGCGLVFVNPRIKDVEGVYKENAVHTQYYEHTTRCDEQEFAQRLRFIRRYCPSGRLLDIGCATGTFLKLAKGWDAHGIDVNAHSISVCKKAGLNVKLGFLKKNTYPKHFFDVIHMSDVIEHMENPLETLKLCATFLKPGGYIMITTPNFASSWARKFQIKPTDHLYYFTAATFRQTVREAGLVPLRCVPINRLRDLKALEYSTSIEPGLLARLFFGMVKLIPTRAFCVRLPFKDDLLLFAQKPRRAEALNNEHKGH